MFETVVVSSTKLFRCQCTTQVSATQSRHQKHVTKIYNEKYSNDLYLDFIWLFINDFVWFCCVVSINAGTDTIWSKQITWILKKPKVLKHVKGIMPTQSDSFRLSTPYCDLKQSQIEGCKVTYKCICYICHINYKIYYLQDKNKKWSKSLFSMTNFTDVKKCASNV